MKEKCKVLATVGVHSVCLCLDPGLPYYKLENI